MSEDDERQYLISKYGEVFVQEMEKEDLKYISNIFDEYENRKEREEKTMISTGRLLSEAQTEKQ